MILRCESLQQAALYPEAFQVQAPEDLGERRVRARQRAFVLRHAPRTDESTAAQRELISAQWGLMPLHAKSDSDARLRAAKLLEARSENLRTSRNFSEVWQRGQRCIVPAMAFHVDDWRSGKAVPTRIARVDGRPMGLAGLWNERLNAEGQLVYSFALLTTMANAHGLMTRYRAPGNDAHMPVILNEGAYEAWLSARAEKATDFIRLYPAQSLTANPLQEPKTAGPSVLPPGLR